MCWLTFAIRSHWYWYPCRYLRPKSCGGIDCQTSHLIYWVSSRVQKEYEVWVQTCNRWYICILSIQTCTRLCVLGRNPGVHGVVETSYGTSFFKSHAVKTTLDCAEVNDRGIWLGTQIYTLILNVAIFLKYEASERCSSLATTALLYINKLHIDKYKYVCI